MLTRNRSAVRVVYGLETMPTDAPPVVFHRLKDMPEDGMAFSEYVHGRARRRWTSYP